MPVAALAKFFDPRLAYSCPLFQLSSRPKVENLARGDFRSFSNEDFLSLRFSVSSAGMPFGGPPRAPKAMGAAREAASSAQSNGTARGPGSLPESNSTVVNPNLRDRCFRVARQAPSLYGATEGSASEAADVETKRFG